MAIDWVLTHWLTGKLRALPSSFFSTTGLYNTHFTANPAPNHLSIPQSNKTLRSLNSSNWGMNSQHGKSKLTCSNREPWPKNWRCWSSFQLHYIWLHNTPVCSKRHGLMTQQNHIMCKDSRSNFLTWTLFTSWDSVHGYHKQSRGQSATLLESDIPWKLCWEPETKLLFWLELR